MSTTSDPFSGALDCASCSLAFFSSERYIPLRDYSVYTPLFFQRDKAVIWTNNWDDKPRKKYYRSLNIGRDYFYYENNVECRGTVKKALLQGLVDRTTFSSDHNMFTFMVTNDLEEIDSAYGKLGSDLIIYGSQQEALNQYHRILKVLTWLNENVPLYLQRSKSWDIMGPKLLDYVSTVDTPLSTLESVFQKN